MSTTGQPAVIEQPVFMASVFKSGTWLVRRIITDITGLEFNEPAIVPGEMNHEDPSLIEFKPGHFFSWHSVPTAPVRELLKARNAKVILLTRNIFDLSVSMYRHFANDIDAEIGRGAGQKNLFGDMSPSQGIALTINGAWTPGFGWTGMGPHLHQVQEMLAFAREYPCCVLSFEQLMADRAGQVKRIADYLGIPLDAQRLAEVAQGSSFSAMKAAAEAGGGASHFQEGKPGGHAKYLFHYHVHMIRHLQRVHAPDLDRYAREADMRELTYCMLDDRQGNS